MTAAQFKQLGEEALEMLRSRAPYKTGNLRDNAIKIEWKNENNFELYVDEQIAPYMKYTNEPWEHKSIKRGNFVKGETIETTRTWDNPNEGWFDKAAQDIVALIAKKMGGTIE